MDVVENYSTDGQARFLRWSQEQKGRQATTEKKDELDINGNQQQQQTYQGRPRH